MIEKSDEQKITKVCEHCKTEISPLAKKCPHCQSDLRNWFVRHPIVTLAIVLIVGQSLYKIASRFDVVRPELPAVSAPTAEPVMTPEEQKVWDVSEAGKLCYKHSDWTRDECTKVTNGEVWIGMTVDMLTLERGYPNSINVSNYGRGDEYQYCWRDKLPRCFYFKESELKIDAYN